jgi:hypothetical protein
MARLITGRDAKIWIGPSTDAGTLSEFQAVTGWVEIKDVVRIAPRGGRRNIVTRSTISDDTVRKATGVEDSGNADLTCGIDTQDPGQQALRAAYTAGGNYAFKVSPRDRPEPTGTDSIQFFKGPVASAEDSELANETPYDISFSIPIDGKIFRVEAAEAP